MASSGQLSRRERNKAHNLRRLLRFEVLGQRRVLASITGQVFHDVDDSFHKAEDEVGLARRVVYVDLDDDATVDVGEPIQLTDEEGRFEFDGLATGEYVVRLFNGTDSQVQNTPFLAEQLPTEIPIADPFADDLSDLVGIQGESDLYAYTASGNELTGVDLRTESTATVTLESEIVDFQSLGNGQAIVLLAPSDSIADAPSIVLVNIESGEITPLSVPGTPDSSPYSSNAALNDDGLGLIVPSAEEGVSVPIHSVAFDSVANDWNSTATSFNVDSAAQVFASGASPILLVSQPAGSGTQVALWSTITDSIVPDSDTLLEGVSSVLAFHDQAGLLIVRDATAGVQVLDVGNDFASLYDLPQFTGPVTLDGHRELLFGLLDDLTLGIFDVHDGEMRLTLPLSTAQGAVAGLALSDRGNRIALRRQGSVSQVRIDIPDAHYVSLDDDAATKDVLFGLLIHGENQAPAFRDPPELTVLEDHSLHLNAPGIAGGIINTENDNHVTLQISEASHGTAIVRPDGSLSYVPDDNFFGVDTFDVQISDGRDDTGVVTVTVYVTAVDDPLQGIMIDIPSFPEDLEGPAVIGRIELIEVDGDPYTIHISDSRIFVNDDHEVLISEDAIFDHETEPSVDITIEVVDPFNALDDSIFLATLTIDDVDDAPTDITPLAILADENVPGAELEVITIVDADSTDGYTLEVADERFEIIDGVLRLREGVSLDYESGGTITVPVSVRNGSGELLLTRDVQIYVQDQNDAPTDIYLSGNQIPEMVSGHTVGTITVIDPDAVDQHSLSVDDSRFEIVGTTLKLRDGVHVRRSEQAEIVVNITATDLALASFSKQFTLTVLENDSPWTNPDSPTDVDGSGETTPLDALIIINTLNNDGPRDLIDPFPVTSEAVRYYDVNGDGRITPIDALIIINILNRGGSSAEPEAPGDGSGDDSPSSNPESDSFPTPGPMPHSPSDDDDDED